MFGSVLGNLLGTLYFLYFQIVGVLVMGRILKKESPLARLLPGSVTGSVLLQWVPVLFAFVFDFTLLSHVLALVATFPLLIWASHNKSQARGSYIGASLKQVSYHKGFLMIAGATMILWIYLLHTHTIPLNEAGAMMTGQCTYGDMNMHLGFITSIAKQGTFPPEYSLFPGAKLSYPFLSDSISSSIYLMGASLRYAYILPMIVAFGQILGSVYLLAHTILRSRSKALLTYLFFFLNGGLGFFYFINWSREGGYTIKDIFTGFYTTPTNLVDHNIRWVNVIADMFLPQRATLFGYAILFPAIWLLYKAAFQERKEYFLPAGILVSTLPMIHTHSFLGMGLISAAWLLTALYKSTAPATRRPLPTGWIILLFAAIMCILQNRMKKGSIQQTDLMIFCIMGLAVCVLYGAYLLLRHIATNDYRKLLQTWGIYLACVLVLALPQLLFWTFGHVIGNTNMLRGHFNWGNLGDFYLWFYLKNMGLPLILGIAGICAKRKGIIPLLMPILVIWFVIELIVFQPNVYDNNKLLYIAYLFLCVIAADYSVELYRKVKDLGGAKWLAGFVLFFSLLSGVLTLGREAVSEYTLYGTHYVELAKYIEENTLPDATILTNTRHNNEIASLTGRNLVCGADTFLYYHGIDTTERKEQVRQMYEYPLSSRHLFEEYSVDYVLISSFERSSYAVDEEALQAMFTPIFESGDVMLYQVK